ncbi:hypothetical protein M5W83_23335 [Paenibacillus thiaminolyticus]|uniref:Uncharacterized protein n=1 Tax=Paenibacillus thiaminolyticus TaxID=49283 RepID=A0ABT4G1X6_PANTH|nr:hypothetical protein [Paenibacillus thiaminolyticus]MCY9536843.1 hypothetical protein [Paenibacillus thiaminolyticus]MCY9605237.1 hypothetical protein [Paenibacillus thiaminolyticus]MCY9610094.1 hypothetical protein [Paenibacillus thiaminolyticus]MCY9615296.1 hypothetical protein [Paenibacillus thiaminolyticus]MCY9622289.1 hypothetical protein [Paenibacillus thiaminolyticus]
MAKQVLKWICLLSVASIIVNGLLFMGTGSQKVLISLCSAVGLGIVSGIGLLATRKKG